MHYLGSLALTALLFGSTLAAPLADAEANKPKPPKPTPTPGPVQGNSCGNGATPYCCNTDGFGYYTTCSLYCKIFAPRGGRSGRVGR